MSEKSDFVHINTVMYADAMYVGPSGKQFFLVVHSV